MPVPLASGETYTAKLASTERLAVERAIEGGAARAVVDGITSRVFVSRAWRARFATTPITMAAATNMV